MSTESTPTFFRAFGKAPATSPSPPVLEYGTASADMTATRISLMKSAQYKMHNGNHFLHCALCVEHSEINYVCIEARNSAFVFVFDKRSMTTSICSTGE